VQTQVAIVGGGPVGLGLAIELGRRQIDVVLMERTTRVHDIPKGQNLTQRTMEHFTCWGVEPEIRASRLMPHGYPAAGVNAYGSLLSQYAHPWFRRSQVDPYYFAASERLPQYLTERVLRRRVAELHWVRALYGADVIRVEASSEGVVATTEDGRRVEARYLVGCDGSHSMVRESAGIAETLSDHTRKMVLLVFRSPQLHDIVEARFGPAAFFNVLHPDLDGYWRFLGRVDVGEGWFFHAPVDASSDVDGFDYRGLLHDSVGAEFEVDLDHIGFWDLRIASAEDYREGPVLVAGDAAHSHPPYGGYGINTGLEDARNLGWKLAATLRGWGGDHLLDSYDEERRPVFRSTARDFIETFIENDRRFIRCHDPDRDETDFAHAWELRRRGAEGTGVGDFEPHYEGSTIVFGPEGGQSGATGEHSFTARPGHHLPPPGPGEAALFSRLSQDFTFIGSSPSALDRMTSAAHRLGVPVEVVEDGSYGEDVLVRPDHFISWVGDGTEADPLHLLRRSAGG
jgi:2-polyprenyl-6-methoxyphenol hydroxylase-like FAD-dependent oxidoreductase